MGSVRELWPHNFVRLPTGMVIHYLGSRNKGTDEWVRIPKFMIHGPNGLRWEGTEEEYVELLKRYNKASRAKFIMDLLRREGP